jgi:hypothetical protein
LTMKYGAAIFAASFVFASSASASEPGKFERTMTVAGPVSLNISSGPGGASVTVGTSRTVVIRAVIRAAFGRADLGLAEVNIRALQQNPPIEQNGDSIRIGYVKNEALLKGVSVTYEIETPLDTQVQAFADAGGLHIQGVQGSVETTNDAGLSEVSDVKGSVKMTTRAGGIVVRNAGGSVSLRNQSGGIQLDGSRGAVEADTKSGRIELANVAGDVRATTDSASIRLHAISGKVVASNRSGSIESLASEGAIQASTVSGSIRISQTRSAPVQVVSGSGAIHIELAAGTGYTLNLRSEKGKVSVPEAIASHLKDQRNLSAQVMGGGPTIDVETRSSKIEIQ